MIPFDLSPLAALWLAFATFGAAFVRGYSGFGFAALIVSAGALVTNPLHLVPVVLLADILLTAQQARGIRADVDWRRVGWLLLGCLPVVPIGVWGMARLGADIARIVISGYILVMCGVLLAGWRLERAPGAAAHVATGILSGLANGAAVGGLPVAAFFAAQPIAAATFRATLIAYFPLLDLVTLPLLASAGLITADTLWATALGLPLMMAGIALGGHRFRRTSPQSFRRFAILLLAVLAMLGLWRSLG